MLKRRQTLTILLIALCLGAATARSTSDISGAILSDWACAVIQHAEVELRSCLVGYVWSLYTTIYAQFQHFSR
jgi:urea transporter